MTTIITREFIVATVDKEVERAQRIFLGRPWAHYFSRVEIKPLARAFGRASIYGVITINEHYVGTSDVDGLVDTIRHEIAHLHIGIRHGHGKPFKLTARALGCKLDREWKRENAGDTLESIGKSHPYEIWAIDCDGGRHLVKTAVRISSKWRNYERTAHLPGNRMRIRSTGLPITRFEIVHRRGAA